MAKTDFPRSLIMKGRRKREECEQRENKGGGVGREREESMQENSSFQIWSQDLLPS